LNELRDEGKAILKLRRCPTIREKRRTQKKEGKKEKTPCGVEGTEKENFPSNAVLGRREQKNRESGGVEKKEKNHRTVKHWGEGGPKGLMHQKQILTPEGEQAWGKGLGEKNVWGRKGEGGNPVFTIGVKKKTSGRILKQ